MKWEYKSVYWSVDHEKGLRGWKEDFNEFGLDGWELVAVYKGCAHFKRLVTADPLTPLTI